jgi:membrane protein YdbS with pleckstrin-like domain
MNLRRQYIYGPPWRGIVAFMLFFGALSAFMVHHAGHMSRRTRAVYNGLIPLTSAGATVYYWFIVSVDWLAACIAVFVFALALLLFMRRLLKPRILELAENGIELPHGYFHAQIRTIPYLEIKLVQEKMYGKRAVLNIATAEQTFEIPSLLLPNLDCYRSVKDIICSRVSASGVMPLTTVLPIENIDGVFHAKKAALNHHLTRLGPFPWGIIYTLILILPIVGISMLLFLALLPLTEYSSEDRTILRVKALCILAMCATVLASIRFATKAWRKKLTGIDFECPSCHQFLGSTSAKGKLEIGRCATCGRRIFGP